MWNCSNPETECVGRDSGKDQNFAGSLKSMSNLAAQLRNDLASRAAEYAQQRGIRFRQSHQEYGSVVFLPDVNEVCHGNFHPASYRAILARPTWRKRLTKVLTVNQRLRDFDDDRRLCELDSCCSSDALLMNVFCCPRVRRIPAVLGMLGVQEGSLPIFGWRARVPLRDGNLDRTEVDMKFGNLLLEAKLTEACFECCPIERMRNYAQFDEVFCLNDLPRRRRQYQCYQLLRNVLAANAHQASFCLVTDARRSDLIESWFGVLAAVRPLDLRTRCKLLTWQELARALPRGLKRFLEQKYGISAGIDERGARVGY